MTEQAETKQSFQVGICMAGAISAGGYTAGVMDYLIEALEEWEKKKGEDPINTPNHSVQIPAIGGASAGGMTGIIAAAALCNPIVPIKKITTDVNERHTENKFYHSWVDLTGDDMFPLLLDDKDITDSKTIYSLLNSRFIDQIAERALAVDTLNYRLPQYINPNLKVFTTLTNLEGMSFNISFKSNSDKNKYEVSRHNDFACFVLGAENDVYKNDGWIPLNFKNGTNVNIARDAAMATGAFPVGLRARRLKRSVSYINQLSWLKEITDINPISGGEYNTINIDGGTINNEPFEKVRELLNDITKETPAQYTKYDTFKSTVLMIDPFPSEHEEFENNDELLKVMGNTLSAMMGHLRTKSTTLVDAMDSNNASQFLVAPKRKILINNTLEDLQGAKAIACGTLGGFGGFISKEFRVHDYFLGRANCEEFLRNHFTVPNNTSNAIFVDGYANVANKDKFKSELDGGLQIIPIFTKKGDKMYMPTFNSNTDWPVIDEKKVNKFKPLIGNRVESILKNIVDYNPIQKVLLWIGIKLLLKGKIAEGVLVAIKTSLKRHKLLNE
jgi:predicted acylesterase/phospholipase RssA